LILFVSRQKEYKIYLQHFVGMLKLMCMKNLLNFKKKEYSNEDKTTKTYFQKYFPKLAKSLFILVIALVLGLSLNYTYSTFGPIQVAPGGNPIVPILSHITDTTGSTIWQFKGEPYEGVELSLLDIHEGGLEIANLLVNKNLKLGATSLKNTYLYSLTIPASETEHKLCVKADGELMLCGSSTYSCVGSWTTSSGTGGSCVRTEYPMTTCQAEAEYNYVPELGSQACSLEETQADCQSVGSSGFYTHITACYRCGWTTTSTVTNYCSTINPQTESACESQNSACTWVQS
jgi:hypothetical protein